MLHLKLFATASCAGMTRVTDSTPALTEIAAIEMRAPMGATETEAIMVATPIRNLTGVTSRD